MMPKWGAGLADQVPELKSEVQYVIQTKCGPVTIYYREDIDTIIVQARAGLLVQPRADNSVGLIHNRERGRN